MTGDARSRRRRPAAAAAHLHQLDLPSGEVVEIILRNLADAVYATDLDNHITYWGPSAERLFGYRASEAVGRSFGDLLRFRIAEGSDEGELLRTIAAGDPWRGQGTVTLHDGGERWIESTVNPLIVDGRVIGSVSVSRDMTVAVAAANRRTAEQNLVTRVLEGLDAVGQLLAQAGPTPEALASVLTRLAGLMGYPYLSLYLSDAGGLRLGGQVGYERLPGHIDPGVGVIGRVLRSGEAAFVSDVSSDAEYRAGNPDVTSEIAVPLRGGGDLLGVLNVESTRAAPLTADDVHLISTVADRLANALLLGREQQELRDRTRLFAAVTVFAGVAECDPGPAAPGSRAGRRGRSGRPVGHVGDHDARPDRRTLSRPGRPRGRRGGRRHGHRAGRWQHRPGDRGPRGRRGTAPRPVRLRVGAAAPRPVRLAVRSRRAARAGGHGAGGDLAGPGG